MVTYQLLSGRLPYEASSLTELALMQQREAPPLLHELVAGVPPQLAAAVDRALALNPGDRFADADQMRSALVDGARGVGAMPEGDTAATQVAAPATSPARVAPRDTGEQPAQARRIEPRQPRRPPPSAPPARAERPAPPTRRGGAAGLRRALALGIVLALVAAGIYIAVQANSGTQTVQLRSVTGSNVQDTVDRVRNLVDDNTG